MQWIPFPDERIDVRGLYWFAETSPHLCRFPERFRARVRVEVWERACMPSGGRLCFRSDTTALALRIFSERRQPGGIMSDVGRNGFDVYADGAFCASGLTAED